MIRRRVLGLAVASGVVAAGTFAAPSASAAGAAAACRGATGVTVIVDYNEIGGPTRAGCAPDGGGRSGAQAFADAGFSLEYDPRQPGYVCKVTGLPTDRPCLENDSFWSLWWSDGNSGRWVFSNQGVGGLDIPDGGYVAFAWHEGSGHADPPDVVPTAHEEPSEEPSDNNGDGGDGGDGGDNDNGGDIGGGTTDPGSTTAAPPTSAPTTTATTGTTTSESAAKRRKQRDQESTEPTTSATSSSTVPGAAEITAGPPESDLATDTSDDGGGALTTWVGLGLAVLVLGAAGLVTLLRRRTG